MRLLRQQLSDFAIRIRSPLLAAKQLHDEQIVIQQRGVALFGRAAPHGQRRIARTTKSAKGRARNAPDHSVSRRRFLPTLNESQESRASAIVANGVVQETGATARDGGSNDRTREGFLNMLCLLAERQ